MSYDILSFCETWLSDQDDLTPYEIPGYQPYYLHRKYSAGGGVAVYIKKSFTAVVMTQYTFSDVKFGEILTLEIQDGNSSVIVSSMYKAPKIWNENFLGYLESREPDNVRTCVFYAWKL